MVYMYGRVSCLLQARPRPRRGDPDNLISPRPDLGRTRYTVVLWLTPSALSICSPAVKRQRGLGARWGSGRAAPWTYSPAAAAAAAAAAAVVCARPVWWRAVGHRWPLP